MSKTIRKWFWVWNQDKEKAFLEEMAEKGYRLTSVRLGSYEFEEDDPREVIYQFSFRGMDKFKEDEYLQLYEDAGWNFVSRLGSWYYFCREKTAEEPDLSLFNNNESMRAQYRRLIIFLLIIGVPMYLQLLIMFPDMAETRFEFPGFYFFFRIFVIILFILHTLALGKIFLMYRKLKDYLRE